MQEQAQAIPSQQLVNQSEIDELIKVQSVLSQIIIKSKLKTDTPPITYKQIIIPKFNNLSLQSINMNIFWSSMNLSF